MHRVMCQHNRLGVYSYVGTNFVSAIRWFPDLIGIFWVQTSAAQARGSPRANIVKTLCTWDRSLIYNHLKSTAANCQNPPSRHQTAHEHFEAQGMVALLTRASDRRNEAIRVPRSLPPLWDG
eukprot:SAG11_NODE_275_length_11309_cov_6.090901_9_plen_122_part_00